MVKELYIARPSTTTHFRLSIPLILATNSESAQYSALLQAQCSVLFVQVQSAHRAILTRTPHIPLTPPSLPPTIGLRLRLLPLAFLLCSSITFPISNLPFLASTSCLPILILISRPVGVVNNLLNNKCFIITHTKIPQSLQFSCWGESSKSCKWISRFSNMDNFSQIRFAGMKFAEWRLS